MLFPDDFRGLQSLADLVRWTISRREGMQR